MKNNYLFLKAVLLFTTFTLQAQDGQLDTSFGDSGIVQTDLYNSSLDFGYSLAIQSDGNLVAAGGSEMMIDRFMPTLVRYLPNGDLDPSFGSSGIVTTNFNTIIGFDAYHDVFIQEDDKIVAGGDFGFSSSRNMMLSRYLVDGSLDPSFGTDGITIIDQGEEDSFSEMGITNGGKILAVGVSKINGSNLVTFMRFLPDGDLDITFGDNGIQSTGILAPFHTKLILHLFEDDSMLIGGRFDGTTSLGKFDSEGILDPAFGDNGIVHLGLNPPDAPFSVTSEGKIVVGLYQSIGNDEFEGVLKRYLPNGNLDNTFGDNGSMIVSPENFRPRRLIIQPNQKILIFGIVSFSIDGNISIVTRYRSNGALDNAFGQNGVAFVGEIDGEDMMLQEDGKIVCLGPSWFEVDFFLARFLNDPFTFGIKDQDVAGLRIFPNPSNGLFKIQHDFILDSEVLYQIFDVLGKVIAKGSLTGGSTTIDLSLANNGMYFLNASGKIVRLIKE